MIRPPLFPPLFIARRPPLSMEAGRQARTQADIAVSDSGVALLVYDLPYFPRIKKCLNFYKKWQERLARLGYRINYSVVLLEDGNSIRRAEEYRRQLLLEWSGIKPLLGLTPDQEEEMEKRMMRIVRVVPKTEEDVKLLKAMAREAVRASLISMRNRLSEARQGGAEAFERVKAKVRRQLRALERADFWKLLDDPELKGIYEFVKALIQTPLVK